MFNSDSSFLEDVKLITSMKDNNLIIFFPIISTFFSWIIEYRSNERIKIKNGGTGWRRRERRNGGEGRER